MSRPALLIDTNVWVDYELGGDNADAILAFMRAAARHDARLGIAAHSLKDVFAIVERRLKRSGLGGDKAPAQVSGAAARAVAWGVVEHILEQAEVVGSDYSDAWLAVKGRTLHDCYEDNLVVAAARRMNADLLVTGDKMLLKHAPVAALSVEDATRWLDSLD